MPTKYVVVLGSLLSGLGKGVVVASIAKLLSVRGIRALPLKFDGYLNYDCGTMNPFRHGEVFVLDDKSEVDMDFGTYERFLGTSMKGEFSLTGGKIFSAIIEKERRGDFLGSDVQFVPHVTNYIVDYLKGVSSRNELDVLIIEVGGTVGDIENHYFLEAMRQLAMKEDVAFIDVTYVPELGSVGEQKTKPTQIALRNIMQLGIQPDVIVCRTEHGLSDAAKAKIAMFANLDNGAVIDDHDVGNIYALPVHLADQGLDKYIMARLGLRDRTSPSALKKSMAEWSGLCKAMENERAPGVCIAIVGKYTKLHDAYASIKEALYHAAAKSSVRLELKWVDSEKLEDKSLDIGEVFSDVNGILVPGGFGRRGIEGMIRAISYARTTGVPYLGICLGMQLMAVEFARDVCHLAKANSTEFDAGTRYNVIDLLPGQAGASIKGGTMRLGLQAARVRRGTLAYKAYGTGIVHERHRHRYELNSSYEKTLTSKGLVISAVTSGGLAEIIEWASSFGIGTQAHPELRSNPMRPAPLFSAFISAAKAQMAARKT